MFGSLRSRLWLTYALVVAAALGVVLVGLVWYVLRNPPADRLAAQTLKRAADSLVEHPENVQALQNHPQEAVDRLARALNVRGLVLSQNGAVLADSEAGGEEAFGPLALRILTRPAGLARDRQGQAWLFATRRLPVGGSVILAVRRPAARPLSALLRLREALADELLPPLLQAGGAALLLALLLSYWVARWVAAPLQRMAAASHRAAEGRFERLRPEGPQEVQALAQAFNEMNERVQASQQSQRDFVANVSHELKTPLTSIQGFSQAILDGAASSPAELDQAARIIHSEAGRMHRLVLELLDLARFDAGTAHLEMIALDLAGLVEGAAAQFQPAALKAGIQLEVQTEAVPAVKGDADRLSQVLTNLVDNALKFTPPGGQVKVRLVRRDGQAAVSVADSGPGIAAGERGRIFERFYQTDKARPGRDPKAAEAQEGTMEAGSLGPEQAGAKPAGHGYGLGLAIAREIVLAHRGTLEIENNLPHGSVFVVKLPFARPDDGDLDEHRVETRP